jgi:1,4-dihydroxy-6-naphthoate synthase
MKPLTLAYSPCPNDTFIFTPWVEGHLAGAPPVVERFEDIDTLNRIALAGEADVVKISFHAYGHLRERYCLLRSGGALGRGCGPLVVARAPFAESELAGKTVAIPRQAHDRRAAGAPVCAGARRVEHHGDAV